MIGTAIGLNLIFGIPLEIGVIITALDVFLILYLQKLGFRWVEALIITLLGVIAVCFAIQIALADPDWGAGHPRLRADHRDRHQPGDALSGAGHPRRHRDAAQSLSAFGHRADPRLWRHLPEKREALKFATIDSTVALMFALLINASILILAAATFNKAGKTDVAELGEAHSLLAPLLGLAIAPTLFGIALLCCGINSTVTATLAGQIVMEGFLNIRLPPWLRRLITRAIAIVPAAVVTIWYGESGTAQLLILTQVVLSPAAVLRRVPAGHVHRRPAPRWARWSRRCWLTAFAGADRGGHRGAQRQAAGRLRVCLRRSRFPPPCVVKLCLPHKGAGLSHMETPPLRLAALATSPPPCGGEDAPAASLAPILSPMKWGRGGEAEPRRRGGKNPNAIELRKGGRQGWRFRLSQSSNVDPRRGVEAHISIRLNFSALA